MSETGLTVLQFRQNGVLDGFNDKRKIMLTIERIYKPKAIIGIVLGIINKKKQVHDGLRTV